MTEHNIFVEILFWLILILQIVMPLVFAIMLNNRHKKKMKSFLWGYYQAFFCIGFNIIAITLYILAFTDTSGSDQALMFIFLSLLLLPLSLLLILLAIYTIKRRFPAMIFLTILSFNPAIWLINLFYISRDKFQIVETDEGEGT